MAWIKLRERDVYKTLKSGVDDALADYWMTVGEMDSEPKKHAQSCDKLVLSTFKLLKYVRVNIGGVNWAIDDKKISNDVNDVCTDYYCLGEGESTSFQEESDALELLSRTAYREMKKALVPGCLWCGDRSPDKSVWCKNCGEAKDSLDKPREEWR